ncbi:hypothetical protein JOD46_000472 [Agromyces aurantiacus]|nr:hypothetical protein [Agromyces aurantiacus]
MFATMLVIGLIAGWAIAATLVELRQDGFRRTPTRVA